MSAFSQAAALVKGAVLSTFGESMQILDTNKTTVLATVEAHIASRVTEPDEYIAVTVEMTMVKLDRVMASYIKQGRYLKHGDKIQKFTSPADPARFVGARSGTEHFIYWYVI
ncbi:hypothetical protein RHSA111115_13135 [Rheinheimera salexigens]|uniref:Uncharacterized protein n=2 Tax=Rheinheimera salexigens TaxID=1628148 RepID=A0A1E7Q820_9GAMM|nr:hypothetical protein BI198_12710 [Rheinheimera salexigens]